MLYASLTVGQINNNITQQIEAEGKTQYRSQVGYYDLLANKEEIYNLTIQQDVTKSYTLSLTAVNNDLIQLTAKLVAVENESQDSKLFSFIPLRYENSKKESILSGIIDYTQTHGLMIRELAINTGHLAITNNGTIILLDQHKPAESQQTTSNSQ